MDREGEEKRRSSQDSAFESREGMATTRKLSVDGSVKEYKVPLEATPSFLSNNLCSTTSNFDDAPSSETKCVLLYSSGVDYHWLYNNVSNLADELGKSVKENRYECVKPGSENGESDVEDQGVVFVLEENVDKTWTSRRGCVNASDAATPTSTRTSSLRRQSSSGLGGNLGSALRMRQAAFHRVSSKHVAIAACVSNTEAFEVEIYLVTQNSTTSDLKSTLQCTFSPNKRDPTAEWWLWNSKQEVRRPCYTQGSAVVYSFGGEACTCALAKANEKAKLGGGNEKFWFLNYLESNLCIGCSSGDTFVFQVIPDEDEGEVTFNYLATLSPKLGEGGSPGGGKNMASASPVSCLCSMEEMHLLRYAQNDGGDASAPAGCLWENVLFVGHGNGAVVMWALGEEKASIAWEVNVSDYFDDFHAENDSIVSMRLLATSNQLLLSTLSGHLLVFNFADLSADAKSSADDDSIHLLKVKHLKCRTKKRLGKAAGVESVDFVRAHAGWVTGMDVLLTESQGKHLCATCAQDGSLHVCEVLREARAGDGGGSSTYLRPVFSHAAQNSQFTGVAFVQDGGASVKIAITSYEANDVSIFHVDV